MVLTEVTDPAILAAFAPVMGPDEILGTAPCPVIDRVGQADR